MRRPLRTGGSSGRRRGRSWSARSSLMTLNRTLIARHRGDHNRLGFALQLTTVRSLGVFLADPLEVPGVVLDYLAGQLGVADPSCVARYMERRTTRFEHADEIKRARGLRDFTAVARELETWVDARAWTTR